MIKISILKKIFFITRHNDQDTDNDLKMKNKKNKNKKDKIFNIMKKKKQKQWKNNVKAVELNANKKNNNKFPKNKKA